MSPRQENNSTMAENKYVLIFIEMTTRLSASVVNTRSLWNKASLMSLRMGEESIWLRYAMKKSVAQLTGA